MQVIASTVDATEAVAQLATEFIVAQQPQFPQGVPAAMRAFLVTPDEVASSFKEVQDLNLSEVYISESSAPRSRCCNGASAASSVQ